MTKPSDLWGMRWHHLMLSVLVAVMMSPTWTEARDQAGVLKASDVIGMKVQGTDGKGLGTIKDLVLDPADGDVQYAVLDFGGFLGIKDKYFMVPWEAIMFNPNSKKIVLDVSKRDLKQAPGFDRDHWLDLSDRQQQVMIYEFYEIPLVQQEKQGNK